jgi:hypothetical protein
MIVAANVLLIFWGQSFVELGRSRQPQECWSPGKITGLLPRDAGQAQTLNMDLFSPWEAWLSCTDTVVQFNVTHVRMIKYIRFESWARCRVSTRFKVWNARGRMLFLYFMQMKPKKKLIVHFIGTHILVLNKRFSSDESFSTRVAVAQSLRQVPCSSRDGGFALLRLTSCVGVLRRHCKHTG